VAVLNLGVEPATPAQYGIDCVLQMAEPGEVHQSARHGETKGSVSSQATMTLIPCSCALAEFSQETFWKQDKSESEIVCFGSFNVEFSSLTVDVAVPLRPFGVNHTSHISTIAGM